MNEDKGVQNVGAMKKKTKGKAAKKSAKKKKAAPKNPADAAQVLDDISGMVRADARNITAAVMAQARNGALAPARYLLEMAGVYPRATDGSQATTEEDCLAKTLLDRLSPARKAAPSEDAEGEASPGTKAEDEALGQSVTLGEAMLALPSGSD